MKYVTARAQRYGPWKNVSHISLNFYSFFLFFLGGGGGVGGGGGGGGGGPNKKLLLHDLIPCKKATKPNWIHFRVPDQLYFCF